MRITALKCKLVQDIAHEESSEKDARAGPLFVKRPAPGAAVAQPCPETSITTRSRKVYFLLGTTRYNV